MTSCQFDLATQRECFLLDHSENDTFCCLSESTDLVAPCNRFHLKITERGVLHERRRDEAFHKATLSPF